MIVLQAKQDQALYIDKLIEKAGENREFKARLADLEAKKMAQLEEIAKDKVCLDAMDEYFQEEIARLESQLKKLL